MSRKNKDIAAIRREEILQAAARVFKQKGFHLARTENICAEAGMSAGSLFRYFKTKNDIIASVIEQELTQDIADIKELVSKEGLQWVSKLTAKGFLELFQPKGSGLSSQCWLELSRTVEGKEQLDHVDRELKNALMEGLATGQREGWVRPDLDVEGASTIFLALVTGLQLDADLGIAMNAKATAKSFADLVSRFILNTQ